MQGAAAFVILCAKDIMGENFIQNVVAWSVESIISYLCESIISSRCSLDSAILWGKITLLFTKEGIKTMGLPVKKQQPCSSDYFFFP